MGKPNRPTSSITFEQARAYESSRVKWIEVCGHVTNVKELADEVFHIPHGTVIRRLEAGWPLEAAFLADIETHWNRHTIIYFQNQPSTRLKFELMVTSHYNPNKQKTKKAKKGEQVIDGGFF